MARKRGRKAAMAAAGLATAAAPFVLGQHAAEAAQSRKEAAGTIEFVNRDGTTVECDAQLTATHDTDDPNRPELRWDMSVSGNDFSCLEVSVEATASYKDKDGTTQQSSFAAAAPIRGSIARAYSPTSVRLSVRFFECDPIHELPCTLTITASPK